MSSSGLLEIENKHTIVLPKKRKKTLSFGSCFCLFFLEWIKRGALLFLNLSARFQFLHYGPVAIVHVGGCLFLDNLSPSQSCCVDSKDGSIVTLFV